MRSPGGRTLAAALVAVMFSLFAQPGLTQAALPPITAADHVIGSPNAPVTVIEYGSFACPQCAQWQMSSWLEFKARFVDTGQVRFVFREILTEPTDMAAMGAALARCSAPDRYFDVAHELFRWQSTARNIGPMSDWHDRAIAASGRSPEQMRACVEAPATLAAIRRSMDGGLAAGVRRTPTFFVDGRMTEDGSLDGLANQILSRRP